MTRTAHHIGLLLVLALAAPPRDGRAATDATSAPGTAVRTTRVSYLAGASVYIEAGRLDGLAAGDTVVVVRDGGQVASLRVTVLSGHHAACDTLSTTAAPRTGDTVRYTARAIAVPATTGAAADSAVAAIPGAAADTVAASPAMPVLVAVPPPPPPRLRGRIGASGLFVDQGEAGGFRRPAFDMHLDGRNLHGGFDAALDMRSDQVVGTGATPSEAAVGRVYRGSLSWHDRDGRWRVTGGRQSSASLSSVSLFDGALAEVNGRRFGAGVFAGTQPEPTRLKFSTAIFEQGLFGVVRSLPGQPRRWSVIAGGVSSSDSGQTNRDFVFAQGSYQDARTVLSYTQEVDVLRGWRAEGASSTLSPTSAFAVARVQATRVVAVEAGYDGRRDVRLYPDRVTPETQFDDRFRQGTWGGITFEPARRVRLQGDVRQRFGSADDRATTWTGSAEWYGLGPWRARLRARGSSYSSDATGSQLWTFGLGADPLTTLHIEVAGGTRATTDHLFGLTDRAQWTSVDGDLALFLRWFLTGSFSRERGDTGDLTQSYLGLSWRF
ncbi:MAG: hypothetical protein ACHQ52_01815 [Candidatus Eisenbacteria bacterium]